MIFNLCLRAKKTKFISFNAKYAPKLKKKREVILKTFHAIQKYDMYATNNNAKPHIFVFLTNKKIKGDNIETTIKSLRNHNGKSIGPVPYVSQDNQE